LFLFQECQQTNPRPFSCYASAPNDVWSLGVILVNLTCGRNPWKRASTEDATFRAYLKDADFLRTILPVSSELNVILRRIFECDPVKRITIPELRQLILECARFTTAPQTSGYPEELPYAYGQYPPMPPVELLNAQYSDSAVSDTSLTDDDTISSVSSGSDYAGETEVDGFTFVEPQLASDFWCASVPAADVAQKSMGTHPVDPYIAVY
jgi:serine/threonine protein kinase